MKGHSSRKGRGSATHSLRRQSLSTSSPLLAGVVYSGVNANEKVSASADLSLLGPDVEMNSILVNQKECVLIALLLLLLAALSVTVGMAAQVAITAHYLYAPKYSFSSRMPLRVPSHDLLFQRRTLIEPSMVEGSHGPPPLHKLNKFVSSASPDLRQSILALNGASGLFPVVEEVVPLGSLPDQQSLDSFHWVVPRLVWEEMNRFPPSLCSDGRTMGYDDWASLRGAVRDANAFSAESYLRWTEYFAMTDGVFDGHFDDPSLYFEKDIVLTICPGVTLKARNGPIFINAENVIIQCDGCSIAVRRSHFSFGPYAKNIRIRGLTFKRAIRSSMNFYSAGAQVTFEDCLWAENGRDNRKFGSIVDVNSTSTINFLRCRIGVGQSGILSFIRSFVPFVD